MRYECYHCSWEGDEDEMVGETCPSCGSDNVDLSDRQDDGEEEDEG